MSAGGPNLEPEIAHILSIDVVCYSKFLVNEQIAVLDDLKRVVLETHCSSTAEANGQLIRIPTGDGMVLLFFRSPEEPLQCAVEIAEALKEHPQIKVRMGAHSGPINKIEDVNDRLNVAGAGVNVAQRVLDCGDANHILLSKRLADDLVEYGHWRPHLHDLGPCLVKHGLIVHLVNFFNGSVGNPQRPQKLQQAEALAEENLKPATNLRRRIGLVSLAGAIVLLAILGFVWWRTLHSPNPETIPPKSVAVLPFQNLSDDPKNAFFAEGMQDEILTHLNKVADLKVISRTSVMKYRDKESLDLHRISNDLRVRYFLEGSVQRSGARVRVSARLVDGLNGAQLSAADYDRDLADVFKIQTEIAERIVSALEAKFTPEEKAAIETRPTSDLAAYELYVRAKSMITRVAFESSGLENLVEAAQLLEEAVTRDPAFYLAYCQLAWAHDQIYFYGLDRTAARLAQARAALDTATRLHPDFGESRLAAAVHAYYGYRDYDRARNELAQAERQLPNDPYPPLLVGYIDRRQGRWKSSSEHFRRALQLDPRNLVILKQLAHNFQAEHDYEHMRSVLDRALAIVPDDPALQVQRAAIEFDEHGNSAPMQAAIEAALLKDAASGPLIADQWFSLALSKSDAAEASRALAVMRPNGAYEDGVPFPKSWCEGMIARLRGDETAARTAFNQAREEVTQMTRAQSNFAEGLSALGMIEAALGEKEQAIADGKRAVDLLPASKDAIVGTLILRNLATIYAWTGEKDAAQRELQAIVSRPSYLSYGMLMHHPFWASLRNDPGFQKIVSSLAPST